MLSIKCNPIFRLPLTSVYHNAQTSFSGCPNHPMQPENQMAKRRQRLLQSAKLLSGCL
ncbi:hypothetical protein [Kingella oralis]|uniref:hypothetical protein n=1 Tax=Kingella oralis TaxID=505 RepID=UPI002D7E6513|nr:hypothetical protein [Kingella oralis]